MNQYQAIPIIKDLIVKEFKPDKIYLFGSCAKKCIKENSDIDICIIKSVDDKRKYRQDITEFLLDKIEFEVDIVVFTVEEWEKDSCSQGTFAGLINSKGEQIYG